MLALIGGAAAALPAPAQADPYRWCGVYGGDAAAITNCYFVTIAQCRMAISGNGGYCVPNQFYDGRPVAMPGELAPPPRRSRG
jgi:hypothetical protein